MTDEIQDNSSNANQAPQATENKSSGSGVVIIGILALLAFLFYLMMPGPGGHPPEAARRTQCKNNLKQLGVAMHNYHDEYGVFPPAYTVDADGRPLHSWRTLILPFHDQQALYDQIDLTKPWNDPANAKAYESVPSFYRCPSADTPDNHTTYMVILAPGSLFGVTEMKTIRDVKDGTANTLMVIDIGAEHAVHWMEPRDADEQMVLGFRTDNQLQHQGGIQAVFADGAARTLSTDIPTATLKALITAAGGEITGDY